MLTEAWEHRLRSVIRVLAVVLVTVIVALLVVLVVYLSGDDLYLANGTSRWASRTGDAEARVTFWLAVGLVVLAVSALVAGARSGRLLPAVGGTGIAILAVLAETASFVQYTAN
jgi:hypothetical protein